MAHRLISSLLALTLGMTPAHAFDLGSLNPWKGEPEDKPGLSVPIPEVDLGKAWAGTVDAGGKSLDFFKDTSGKAITGSREWAASTWDNRGSIRWNPIPEGWTPSVPLPEGWDVVGWLPVEGLSSGISSSMAAIAEDERVVHARIAIATGIDSLPKDPDWWRDAGIAAAVTSASVGAANAGCVLLTTPGGPVVMAVSGGACGIAASRGSVMLLENGYGMAGVTPNSEAFSAGVRIGTIVGTFGSSYLAGGSIDPDMAGTFRIVKEGVGKATGYLDAWLAPQATPVEEVKVPDDVDGTPL